MVEEQIQIQIPPLKYSMTAIDIYVAKPTATGIIEIKCN